MTEGEQEDPGVGKGKLGLGGRKLDSCYGDGAKSW